MINNNDKIKIYNLVLFEFIFLWDSFYKTKLK